MLALLTVTGYFLLFDAGMCWPLLSGSSGAAKPLSVSSPDGNLTLSFALKANPQPYLPGERAYYRVSYKHTPILTDSPLGLDFYGASSRSLDRHGVQQVE
jgi:hypothetical protein